MAAARGLTSSPRSCAGVTAAPSRSSPEHAVAAESGLHLALDPLEVLERDVEEVAGPAGGVEHTDRREPGEVAAELGEDGPAGVAVVFLSGLDALGGGLGRVGLDLRHGRLRRVPLLAERVDHGWDHEAFDVGPRRVVRAELMALAGVEGPFQERPEDGRLYLAPVRLGRGEEEFELVGRERERVGLGEEAAVEPAERRLEVGREAAPVHRRPERLERVREDVEVVAVAAEEAGERALGDEPGVLSEHREEAPAEEPEHGVGRGARRLQRGRELGERGGQFARDSRLPPRRVERLGVGPGEAEPLADPGTAEVVERGPVRPVVGERDVALGVAEVGVEVEAVPHVARDDERRHGLLDAVEVEVPGVALGLALGRRHRPVPRRRAAPAVSGRPAPPLPLPPSGVLGVDALLRLEHEAPPLVEVDPAGAGVGSVLEVDGPLEDVAVEGGVLRGRLGAGHAEECGELDEEGLRVRELGGLGRLPPLDEGVEHGGVGLVGGGSKGFHVHRGAAE